MQVWAISAQRARLPIVLVQALALFAMAACAPRAEEARQYRLDGQVLAIRPDTSEVLMKHGDVEGFMPGMTKPFKVGDRTQLERISPGDLVTATLVVDGREGRLISIARTGTAPLEQPAEFPAASFVAPLGPGDEAPETTLTDQDGRAISLSDFRESAVALTFIYTRCPLPQFCPLLDRRFADIQRTIAADDALRGRAYLVSVSFDPDTDTPERLRAHARRLRATAEIWRFATAPRQVVDRFAATFGVNVIREADETITHNIRTVVIGPDGRLTSVYNGSDWTPEHIVDDLRRALAR